MRRFMEFFHSMYYVLWVIRDELTFPMLQHPQIPSNSDLTSSGPFGCFWGPAPAKTQGLNRSGPQGVGFIWRCDMSVVV